ncbi:MAG: hypothetical protein ABNO52_01110 [Candidatus Shikimatogenerans sp. Tser]|uniref:Uncharacterized protein n=1 Tax=Candidatus Shikimatogenerans sp. Tser TaxID=3158568 RepID=A0AAU7QR62_9FLAO
MNKKRKLIYSYIRRSRLLLYSLSSKKNLTITNALLREFIYSYLENIVNSKNLIELNNKFFVKKYNLYKMNFFNEKYKVYINVNKFNYSINKKFLTSYVYNHFNFQKSIILSMFFPFRGIRNYYTMRNIGMHIGAFNPNFLDIKVHADIYNKEYLKDKILLYQKFLRDLRISVYEYLFYVNPYIKIINYIHYKI